MPHSPQSLFYREIWSPDDFGWILREETEEALLPPHKSAKIALIGRNYVAGVILAKITGKHDLV